MNIDELKRQHEKLNDSNVWTLDNAIDHLETTLFRLEDTSREARKPAPKLVAEAKNAITAAEADADKRAKQNSSKDMSEAVDEVKKHVQIASAITDAAKKKSRMDHLRTYQISGLRRMIEIQESVKTARQVPAELLDKATKAIDEAMATVDAALAAETEE